MDVGVIVQLYIMADTLHFVEIRRGKGDIFEFHALYTTLLEKLSDLKASPDAAAAAAAPAAAAAAS